MLAGFFAVLLMLLEKSRLHPVTAVVLAVVGGTALAALTHEVGVVPVWASLAVTSLTLSARRSNPAG